MHTAEILYIEDDSSDAEFASTALADISDGAKVNLKVINEGEDAIKYLTNAAPYENTSRPDLIILDLNLPRTDGRELLIRIKSSEALKAIPVVVFTTSSAEYDINECYRLGANLFLTKPLTYDEYKAVFGCLYTLWTRLARLPSRSAANP